MQKLSKDQIEIVSGGYYLCYCLPHNDIGSCVNNKAECRDACCPVGGNGTGTETWFIVKYPVNRKLNFGDEMIDANIGYGKCESSTKDVPNVEPNKTTNIGSSFVSF